MPWIQIHMTVPPEEAEPVEDLLMGQGAVSVTMEDAADQPLFEPDPGTTPLWNLTRVTGLFEGDADIAATQSALAEAYHSLTQHPVEHIESEVLEDRDWERSWMDDFQPLQFGERLWICPSWHTPPDPQAVNLMLDPGLAFGTGTHPTTALCLGWLDQAELTGKQVIDYGCGSGILGLAALLLGAKHCTGVDNDPQALEASRENARRNNVAPDRLSLFLPEQTPETPADVMIANILAQPLMDLAPHLAKLTRPGGDLVLSGILSTQAADLTERYEAWFDMDAPEEQDGWVCLHGTRR
ncbi:50S ribosomal protein L11 methyltransferase [Marinobacteraceae bacterium S3BR75-40.1]